MKRIAAPRPRLSVRDLEVVLALARSGTTARAATALHITQSAVSRALAGAEDRLGTRLFERNARGLVPTAAGERLIADAPTILAELVALEERVAAPRPAPVRLRLVCECYTAYRWLPSTLARLRSQLGALEVTVATEHTAAPVAALEAGLVDVAFLTNSAVAPPLRERALFDDEVVFVVGADHPLAQAGGLVARDLTEHPLLLPSQAGAAEARWFQRRVFGPRRPALQVVRLPLTEAVVDAARAGMGIAVLSEWVATPYVADRSLVIVRLRGRPLWRSWRVAYRAERADHALLVAAAVTPAAPRVAPPQAGRWATRRPTATRSR